MSLTNCFKKCGGYPQIAYSMEEDQGVAGLVGAGFGIAVVPKMPVLSYMPVSIIEIEKPSWERLFYMATLKNVYQAPVIMDLLKKYVTEHAEPVKNNRDERLFKKLSSLLFLYHICLIFLLFPRKSCVFCFSDTQHQFIYRFFRTFIFKQYLIYFLNNRK